MIMNSCSYLVKAIGLTQALLALLVPGARPFNDTSPDGFVIDTFRGGIFNDLGAWHGPGEDMPLDNGDGYIRLFPVNADQNYHTQLSSSCFDLRPYDHMYLHITFAGTDEFSISLNQNNEQCNPGLSPYPETWDTVEASRYSISRYPLQDDIYIPISHFNIDLSRVVSVSLNGFYTDDIPLTLFRVEIVPDIPDDVSMPEKLPSGTMVLKCKRPNSFAFGIDDGEPYLAQQVMEILKEEGILVTFFVVGRGLESSETNFTQIYREMLSLGHQVALHSYSHPK
jgi:Polysaccharide deacetylase